VVLLGLVVEFCEALEAQYIERLRRAVVVHIDEHTAEIKKKYVDARTHEDGH
jgi:hypothetical protein